MNLSKAKQKVRCFGAQVKNRMRQRKEQIVFRRSTAQITTSWEKSRIQSWKQRRTLKFLVQSTKARLQKEVFQRMIFSLWKDKDRCRLSVSSHILYLSNLNSIRRVLILTSLTDQLMAIREPLPHKRRTKMKMRKVSKTMLLVEVVSKTFQIKKRHPMKSLITLNQALRLTSSSSITTNSKLLLKGKELMILV